MNKETRRTDKSQHSPSATETDRTIEALRRQMYQRIANGHALAEADELARKVRE